MGAVISEPIFYNEDYALMEFFRQYHDAPLDVHGVDTTVSVPSCKDMHVARECLGHGTDQLLMEMTLPVSISMWSFIVPIPKAGPSVATVLTGVFANLSNKIAKITEKFENVDETKNRGVFCQH
jgi:hypothetical protein